MPETTYHLNEITHEVVVFSDLREVGVGVTEDLDSFYFLKFYLNPWAYTAIWAHKPFSNLFPWPVVHQKLDKWSPYLISLIFAPEAIEDPMQWFEFIQKRLKRLNVKYGLTLNIK